MSNSDNFYKGAKFTRLAPIFVKVGDVIESDRSWHFVSGTTYPQNPQRVKSAFIHQVVEVRSIPRPEGTEYVDLPVITGPGCVGILSGGSPNTEAEQIFTETTGVTPAELLNGKKFAVTKVEEEKSGYAGSDRNYPLLVTAKEITDDNKIRRDGLTVHFYQAGNVHRSIVTAPVVCQGLVVTEYEDEPTAQA